MSLMYYRHASKLLWVQFQTTTPKQISQKNEPYKYSSIPASEIPCTEEPDGVQSMGSQRVGHDLATKQQQQQFVYYLSLPSKK